MIKILFLFVVSLIVTVDHANAQCCSVHEKILASRKLTCTVNIEQIGSTSIQLNRLFVESSYHGRTFRREQILMSEMKGGLPLSQKVREDFDISYDPSGVFKSPKRATVVQQFGPKTNDPNVVITDFQDGLLEIKGPFTIDPGIVYEDRIQFDVNFNLRSIALKKFSVQGKLNYKIVINSYEPDSGLNRSYTFSGACH